MLKELRKSNNLTQEDVAKIMGVQREVVSYYENGKREIPLIKLKKLLNFLGLDEKDVKENRYERKLQVAYRKEQLFEEDFDEIIWLNNFVNNLFDLNKINGK